MNYEGARVKYKTLEPEEFFDVNTFVAHPWLFQDAMTHERLNANSKDKEAALSVDCSLLRRRRALSNQKWCPIKYIKDGPQIKLDDGSASVATTTTTSA